MNEQPIQNKNTKNAIEFIEVRKDYKDGEAITDLSMTVQEGTLMVIIGASGSGKTTLLKTVNRLIEPSAGKVLFFGEDNKSLPLTDLRRQIGYVLQEPALFPHMRVGENIATVPEILGWPKQESQARTRELLELVRLDPAQFIDRYPIQLSGGQQQRVSIARALAARPKVLLMDEPFAALDIIIRRHMQEDLLSIHKESASTILFVTHDMDEAFRLGDRVAVMNEGRLLQVRRPEELLSNPADDYVAELLGYLSIEAIQRVQKKAELRTTLPEDKIGD